jgi:hypothetical protein
VSQVNVTVIAVKLWHWQTFFMTVILEELINKHLEQIAITDETFTEYIIQILEDDMEESEQIEIISEFLVEASEADAEEERQWVAELIELQKQRKQEQLEALKRKEMERLKVIEKPIEKKVETRTNVKVELTKEQRQERELFLQKYGYEVYDTEEVNGEIEFVGKERKKHDDILNIRDLNVSAVKDKELKRKQDMQQKHQKETQRNKEMLEKQRLEKEIKKKGTQKREKVRG